MRGPQARRALRVGIRLATALALFPSVPGPAFAEQPAIPVEAGRALFLGHAPEEGPEPLAILRGSRSGVPAARFACANCHGRDGLGQGEGSLRAPSIRWQDLARAAPQRGETYDATRFARALADGVDPGGRTLDRLMPSYVLSEVQTASLIAYLKAIDEDQRVGVGPSTIRLGILSAGVGDGFPATLAQAFGQALPSPVFGRRVELVPLDGEDGLSPEGLRRAAIFAAVGLPASSRALWPELRRLGIPNLFPRALLDGDEPEAEVAGLLPTLDAIGRAALEQALTCAQGPLTIAVGDRDSSSRRLAAAASAQAAIRPGLPQPAVRPVAELIRDAPRSAPESGCILVFADPEEVLALLSSSPPRRYVGLTDQFMLVQALGLPSRHELVLADPRVAEGVRIDSPAFAGMIAAAIEQSLRRTGRQVTRSRVMAELYRVLRNNQRPVSRSNQIPGGQIVDFRTTDALDSIPLPR